MQLVPTTFKALPNWPNDSLIEACTTFCQKNCPSITNTDQIRQFFEQNFVPYLVTSENSNTGTFTGYYVPKLRGSYVPSDIYSTPIYQQPEEINFTRAEITGGCLADRNLELVWVDDPVDAFFMSIQGSGFIEFADGSSILLGYAGNNEYPYTPIGKALVQMQALDKTANSMQAIRQWLHDHPKSATKVMNLNQRFIFFKRIANGNPVGSQGLPLTAERSLAVDPNYIPLGTPIWLDIEHPLQDKPRIKRLVMAQDTGSAIKGPIRGDFYWGIGNEVGELAGRMESTGSYYMLLPKSKQVSQK